VVIVSYTLHRLYHIISEIWSVSFFRCKDRTIGFVGPLERKIMSDLFMSLKITVLIASSHATTNLYELTWDYRLKSA
jgi:hypothetical protein